MKDQNIELPPLPDIMRLDYVGGSYPIGRREDGEYVDYYEHTAAMQEYARDAIAPYAKRIAELEAQIEADRQRTGEPVAYIRTISFENGEVQRDLMWVSQVGDLTRYRDFVSFEPLCLLAPQPAEPVKCDGNHGGPRCADPECWNDSPAEPVKVPSDCEAIEAGQWDKGFSAACRYIRDTQTKGQPAQHPTVGQVLEENRWRNALVGLCNTDRIDTPEQAVANVKARMRRMGTQPAASAEPEYELCQTGQGNGEIVTDWVRYRRPNKGDIGDEAVAECPDCDGTGKVYTAPFAAQPSEWILCTERLPENGTHVEVRARAVRQGGKLSALWIVGPTSSDVTHWRPTPPTNHLPVTPAEEEAWQELEKRQ